MTHLQGSPSIVLATPFDPHMSAAEILSHLNQGTVIQGLRDPEAGIRTHLPESIPYYHCCSRQVLEPFMLMQALSLHAYEFRNPKIMQDDRLAENFDTIFNCFTLPSAQQGCRVDDFCLTLDSLKAPSMKATANFLMRTYSDYVKILVWHLGVSSLDELQSFVARFADSREGACGQEATESLMAIPAPFLELVLNAKDIDSLEKFGQHLETGRFHQYQEFFREVRFSNLKLVRDLIVFEQIDELERFFEGKRLQENLVKSDVQSLLAFAKLVEIDEENLLPLFVDLLSNSFAQRVEKGINKINEVDALHIADPSLKLYLRQSLRNTVFLHQDLTTVAALAEAGLLRTQENIILLGHARSVLKEFLAPELAERLLKAPRAQSSRILDEFQELRAAVLADAYRQQDRQLYSELNSSTRRGRNSVQALQ